MATIGRSAAVAQMGRLEFSGWPAWAAWLCVHLLFLIGFRNKLAVLLQWTYSYFTYKRGARIITGLAESAGARTAAGTPGARACGADAARGARGVRRGHGPASRAHRFAARRSAPCDGRGLNVPQLHRRNWPGGKKCKSIAKGRGVVWWQSGTLRPAKTRMLESLLYPQTIAVIGASRDPSKVGHAFIANLIKSGFAGQSSPSIPRPTTSSASSATRRSGRLRRQDRPEHHRRAAASS